MDEAYDTFAAQNSHSAQRMPPKMFLPPRHLLPTSPTSSPANSSP